MMLPETGSIPETGAELLEAAFVAELCGCSARTVRRLADSGRMPRPVKLGSLIRWRRTEVMDWIESGCQPIQPAKAPPR
jgi:excisionase family DNA binding protein